MTSASASASVMQPYFLPYVGYYQLVAATGTFVVYDQIKYTKKGWINRNRFLRNGAPAVFTIPLRNGADALDVRERFITSDFDGRTVLRALEGSYRRAPHYEATMQVLAEIFLDRERNLFRFIESSLVRMMRYLEIGTDLRRSSDIETHTGLRGQDRVIELCRSIGVTTYVNPIGGRDLYDAAVFAAYGIDLKFIQSRAIAYDQFDGPFVPNLSVVDLLMFLGREQTADVVHTQFDLI